MENQHLKATIAAQEELIEELKQENQEILAEKQELWKDFDLTARSIIGFANDLGIVSMLRNNENIKPARLMSSVGMNLVSGKINFNKLTALDPILEKYENHYSDILS